MIIKIKERFTGKRIKKIILFIFIFIIYISIVIVFNKYIKNYKYKQDDLTLVSAYYKIKSKHLPEEYLKWLNNLVMLNKSFVFFTSKKFMHTLKKMRPKELYYKTVFIELEIEDFYSYIYFYKQFKHSFQIDIENSYHTIPLYLIWAEKCMFLKKAILNNYFNSKCFYWIDAGYFREDKKNMRKYLNNWPSTKKCFKDNRLLMGQVKNFSEIEKKNIVNFDYAAHKRLERHLNVAGNFFGGQIRNTIKFINFYYEALRLFIKNKKFIGKDQNIYTYVAFKHPQIINLILCWNYKHFKKYLT